MMGALGPTRIIRVAAARLSADPHVAGAIPVKYYAAAIAQCVGGLGIVPVMDKAAAVFVLSAEPHEFLPVSRDAIECALRQAIVQHKAIETEVVDLRRERSIRRYRQARPCQRLCQGIAGSD